MMQTLHLIKIGGDIISDPMKVSALIQGMVSIDGPIVLVHGGGKSASEFAKKLEIPVQMVNGRRITDKKMMRIVTMVYAGEINKNLVAELQKSGINAIGLSGADANVIEAVRRPVVDIDYGYAGDVIKVNTGILDLLLQSGHIPVFCPITHDKNGSLLNTNADTIAAEVAIALSKSFQVKLVYAFSLTGLLGNIDNPKSKLDQISEKDLPELKRNGSIKDGILPKLSNAFHAVQNGVKNVYICHYNSIAKPESGTEICK